MKTLVTHSDLGNMAGPAQRIQRRTGPNLDGLHPCRLTHSIAAMTLTRHPRHSASGNARRLACPRTASTFMSYSDGMDTLATSVRANGIGGRNTGPAAASRTMCISTGLSKRKARYRKPLFASGSPSARHSTLRSPSSPPSGGNPTGLWSIKRTAAKAAVAQRSRQKQSSGLPPQAVVSQNQRNADVRLARLNGAANSHQRRSGNQQSRTVDLRCRQMQSPRCVLQKSASLGLWSAE